MRTIRPVAQYTHWIPVQKRRNTVGFRVQGSFLTGYGGLVAPPFQRFDSECSNPAKRSERHTGSEG